MSKTTLNYIYNNLQLKMILFCCHLINRIFEHKHIENNLPYYFEYKKKHGSGKNERKLDVGNFLRWL